MGEIWRADCDVSNLEEAVPAPASSAGAAAGTATLRGQEGRQAATQAGNIINPRLTMRPDRQRDEESDGSHTQSLTTAAAAAADRLTPNQPKQSPCARARAVGHNVAAAVTAAAQLSLSLSLRPRNTKRERERERLDG